MKRSSPLYRSVAYQLLISVIPIAILGIFLTGLVAYRLSELPIFDSIKKDVRSRTFNTSRQISTSLNRQKNDLELLSQNTIFKDYTNNREFGLLQEAETYRKNIEKYLLAFASRADFAKGLWYLDPNGREVATVKFQEVRTRKGEFPQEEFVRLVLAKLDPALEDATLTDPVQDPELGSVVMYVKPLSNSFKERNGTIVMAGDLEPIQKMIEGLRTGESGLAFLAKEDGSAVISGESSAPLEKLSGDHLFSSHQEIYGTPWSLNVWVDLRDFLKPLDRLQFLMTFLSLISAFCVAVVIYRRVNKLIRPIQRLREATRRLTMGDLDQRVSDESQNEVGALSKAFNTMAESLQSRTKDLENRIQQLKTMAQEKARLVDNIRESELRFRTTLDCSLDAIVGLNATFHITTWNQGAETLFGYSSQEALQKPIDLIFGPKKIAELKEMTDKHGRVANHDTQGIRKDGSIIELSLTLAGSQSREGSLKQWSMVLRDVTEEKALQAQLIQAEKLSVVGQLVAGVAHEINNPLTAVVGYSELLSTGEEGLSDQAKEDLGYVYENAIRCRDIVGNLLRFVRKDSLQKKAVDINEVIQNVIKLLDYRLVKKESVRLVWNENASLPKVSGDAQQLEQVFLNLIHNACDAMSGMSGLKKISIHVDHVDDRTEIRLSDNGPGISKNIQEKIFEPFYTTKAVGKGTGLGLAISNRIIQDHQGTIEVKSKLGEGATFLISLPIMKSSEQKDLAPQESLPAIGGKKVLVIDDERDLIPMMKKILVHEGHTVEEAYNGDTGLEKLRQSDFDLVISDMQLGDIRGIDLCRSVRKNKKDLPFIFITGDIIDKALLEEMNELKAYFVSKPFSLEDFRQVIRKMFNERQVSTVAKLSLQ